MSYIFPLLFAFLLTLIITPVIKKLALSFNIVDAPTLPRKIHKRPTPLLGGLAIYLAVALLIIIYWIFGFITDAKISENHIVAILIGGLILAVGGFLDDKYNLKPKQQIWFPVLAAIIVIISGIKITFITNPLGGVLNIPVSAGLILSFFWILGLTYTTKFLDGLDGLTSGVSSIGFIIIFIVSLSWDISSSGTSILALIMAGACLGFLIFNWHPAKIFLGEGGSTFLGFMLAVLSIISGSKIATALLIMGIPILDVFFVIIQRLKSHSSIAAGDQKHLHFRLLQKGFSHRQTVIFLYAATAFFGIFSLLLKTRGKIIVLIILIIFVISLLKFLTSKSN